MDSPTYYLESIVLSQHDRGQNLLFDITFYYYADGKKHTVTKKSCGACFTIKWHQSDDADFLTIDFETVNLPKNTIRVTNDYLS
jgi:hypothetical protein